MCEKGSDMFGGRRVIGFITIFQHLLKERQRQGNNRRLASIIRNVYIVESIEMSDTGFVYFRCNEQAITRFAARFLHSSQMTTDWFSLHIIFPLTFRHGYLHYQNIISIITNYICHITLCNRNGITEIIKIQVGFHLTAVEHCHGSPHVPLEHQGYIVQISFQNLGKSVLNVVIRFVCLDCLAPVVL